MDSIGKAESSTLIRWALRPLEPSDLEVSYGWQLDVELERLSGWGPRLSRAAHDKRWLERIMSPPDDFVFFGIVVGDRLVGRVDLSIDRAQRRGAIGIIIGDTLARGRGLGRAAVGVMAAYAFSVECLDRVYAEVYAFNERARRCFEGAGFTLEGILRGHELHHGERQDLVVYGMLRGQTR